MITQAPINKPSGTQGKDCDPGLPVSGRTSTGVYQILKVNTDGTIPPGTVPLTTAPYTVNSFSAVGVPPGTPPANTFIGTTATFSIGTSGQYKINPTFTFDGTGGGINFVLYSVTSNLGTYISTLPPFNAFAPGITDIATGLSGYWHNTANQAIGTTLSIAYNRTNTTEVYLPAGAYAMAVITDGAVTFTGGAGLIGFYEFIQVS